jgi:hypothetical protein
LQISVYENFRNNNFPILNLGLNERKLRNTMMVDFNSIADGMGYAGFWITYVLLFWNFLVGSDVDDIHGFIKSISRISNTCSRIGSLI